MLIIGDRTQELSSSTGTGDIVLAGPSSKMQSFKDGVGVGNTTYYCVVSGNGWEVGIGKLVDDVTFTRLYLINSSTDELINLNGNSVVFGGMPGGLLANASYNMGRNRLINGSMEVVSGDVPTGWSYAVVGPVSYSGAVTAVTGATSRFAYVVSADVFTVPGSISFSQNITSDRCYDLAGHTISISGNAKGLSTAFGNVWTASVGYPTNLDDFGTVVVTDTKSLVLSGGGSSFTDFYSSFDLTADGFANGLVVTISCSVTNVPQTLTASVTSLQLELGSVPTPYERRPLAYETLLCT